MTARRVGFVVRGRVQGVAFRAFTCDIAGRCGVTGFVGNRPDRAVDGEAQGEPAAVAAFVDWLQEGSRWSRVDQVEVTELAALEREEGFAVRR